MTPDQSQNSRSRVAELYMQYGPAIYRRCQRLLFCPDAARDATQEVFLKVVRDMEKLRERETILPWLYRVATNHCLNVRRTSRRHGEECLGPALEVSSEVATDAYPDRALAQELLSRFDAATQAVAVGVLIESMDHGELAEALGVSRRNVARKLARFLESARAYLDEEARGDPQRPARHTRMRAEPLAHQ